MNSRFKFLSDVDPKRAASKPIKSRFNKLTLSICKPVLTKPKPIEQTAHPPTVIDMAKTPTKQVPKPDATSKATTSKTHEPNGQKQNVLLHEVSSTMSKMEKDESIITDDDDTNSIGSSVDTDFINDIISPTTKVNQSNNHKSEFVEEIGTQLKNISISSPAQFFHDKFEQDAQNMSGLSQKFTEMGLLRNTTDDFKVNERSKQDDEACQSKSDAVRKSLLEMSVVTISSVSAHEREQQILAVHVANADTVETPIDVIVLSDSELGSNPGSRDDINQIVFYNVSTETETEKPHTVNTMIMDKVNKFFDNVPDQIEDSFTTEKPIKPAVADESIYISETCPSDTAQNESDAVSDNLSDANLNAAKMLTDGNASIREADADVFVSAHGSDLQPTNGTNHFTEGQIIAMSVESHADPSPQICTVASDLKEKSPEMIKNAGSSIKITSSNLASCGEKVSISAQININIQISGLDSTTSESDDSNYSNQQLENSSEQIGNNDDDESIDDELQHSTRSTSVTPAKTPVKTPVKAPINPPAETAANTLVKTPVRTPRKTPIKNTLKTPRSINKNTPNSVLKLKQFEFVPPKSLTKTKKNIPNEKDSTDSETFRTAQVEEKSKTTDKKRDDDSDKEAYDFVIDRNIPVAPKDQMLLHKIYGDAWKTPEVIRSYSAVKGSKMRPQVEQKSQSVITKQEICSRMSHGFHLFKRNIAEDLESTRIHDAPELPDVSIVLPSKPPKIIVDEVKSPYFNQIKKIAEEDPASTTSSSISSNMPNTSSASSGPRSTRKARNRKPIKISYTDSEVSDEGDAFQTDDDDDGEWKGAESVSSESESDSDDDFKPSTRGRGCTKKTTTTETKAAVKPNAGAKSKRANMLKDDDQMVFLDLTHAEVIEVDENYKPADVTEDSLTDAARKFLQVDQRAVESNNKSKSRRKLFNRNDYEPTHGDTEELKKPLKEKTNQEDEVQLRVPIPNFFGRFKTQQIEIDKTPTSSRKQRLGELVDKTPKNIIDPNNRGCVTDTKPKNNHLHLDGASTFLTPSRTFEFLHSLDATVSKNLCHPDALIYRNKFNANKEKLTEMLYKLYNEKVFENKLNVPVIWSKKLLTTAGRCRYKKKGLLRICDIELSEKVLTSADRLRCTLIHEMCHAAVWIFNGDGNCAHGPPWKEWASKSNRVFPELPPITVCHAYEIDYKYIYQCNICMAKSKSHSKSKKVENIRCAICHGSISIFLNKRDKDGNLVATPVRKPNSFANFVKAKYKDYRKAGVNHGEVMRLISNAFSSLSVEEKKKY